MTTPRDLEPVMPLNPTAPMANIEVPVELGTVKPVVKTNYERLNEVIASLPVEKLGDGTDLTSGGKVKSTTIVVNQPLMPSNQSMSAGMGQALEAGARAAMDKAIDPNIANVLSALQEAPKFREKNKTSNTQAVINNQLVQIPSAVKDLPGNLYLDSNGNYVRGEADQILLSLLGPVSSLANLWASKRGFAHKPLVWLGNAVYIYVETDKKVDYKATVNYDRPIYDGKDSMRTEPVAYHPAIHFNQDVDDNEEGLLLVTLNRFLYHLTVRNLVRIGKEHNLSVVEVLRCIVGQYDRDHSPRVNPVL
jgi:hypothetical protein